MRGRKLESKFTPDRGYPKPERLGRDDAPALLAEVHDLASTAGVDVADALGEGLAAVERVKTIRREFNDRAQDPGAAVKALARRLIDGSVDWDGAVAEAARIDAVHQDGSLSRAVRRANHLRGTVAAEALTASLDGDAVLADCRRRVAETLAEIRKLRGPLAGIRNADAAVKAGPKAAKAWSTYTTELSPRFEAAYALVKLLRDYHLIDPLPYRLSAYARCARPTLRLDDYQAGKRSGVRLLEPLDPICDRWGLGGPYTEEEALEFDKAAAAEEPAPIETTADLIRAGAEARATLTEDALA